MTGAGIENLFAPPGGWSVRILDLSGASGAEPLETVRGFATLMHANAFARAYVRDSLEACRAPGLTADQVLAAWFAYGEDALVEEPPGQEGTGWRSAAEIGDFARTPAGAEARNWRALDPRRDVDDEDDGAADDGAADDDADDLGEATAPDPDDDAAP